MAKNYARQDTPQAVDPLAKVRSEWEDCTRCPLHGSRSNVVFTRGSVPADICFIGGAPTDVDDSVGKPLSGPTGNMLETIIRELSVEAEIQKSPFTWCAVTTVGCAPWKSVEEYTVRPPDRIETDACLPRLISILQTVKPKGLILLGSVAGFYWNRYRMNFRQAGFEVPILTLAHPNEAIHNGGSHSENPIYSGMKSSLRQFLFRHVLSSRRSSFG